MNKAVQLLCYSFMLSACMGNSVGLDGSTERDAVIVTPNAISRAELLRVVQRALNNATITLADDALTHDSQLIIERTKLIGPDGTRLNGRVLEAPEHFKLIKYHQHCILIQARTQIRWRLAHTSCLPL